MLPRFAATARLLAEPEGEPGLLVAATIARCVATLGIKPETAIGFESNIPRSVGLAGSSAIVIAVLRVVDQAYELDLSAQQITTLAYQVEREDLGIAGGWQDQVVQSRGVAALMDFGEPISHRALALPADPIPLYIAWRDADAEASGESHARLQASRDEPQVRVVMAELADVARNAADAIEKRDVHRLKESIDTTFDLRRSVMDVAPSHHGLVDTARAHGACANFTGSGGSVLGVLPKAGDTFVEAMVGSGYEVMTFDLGEGLHQ